MKIISLTIVAIYWQCYDYFMKRDRAMAFVLKDDKILMVQNYFYQRFFWSLPGGGIEDHETPEQAALRELKEETGIDGEIIRPLSILFHNDGTKEYIFHVRMKDQNQQAITGYDPENLSQPEEIREGIRQTAWKAFEELSRIDQDFLYSFGYMDLKSWDLNTGY